MKGFVSNISNEIEHKSADYVDDGFKLEAINDGVPAKDDRENSIKDAQENSNNEETINTQEDKQLNTIIMNDIKKGRKIEKKNSVKSKLAKSYNDEISESESSEKHNLLDLKESKSSSEEPNLFLFLLQHVNDYTIGNDIESIVKGFQIIDRLSPFLYDLADLKPQNAKSAVQGIIKEKHDDFEKNKKKYPGLDTIFCNYDSLKGEAVRRLIAIVSWVHLRP